MSYIKLDRKMLDWEWFADPSVAHLWIYILLKANHKKKEWHGISVEEGSMVTSENRMSIDTGLSRQQVRTAIKKLIATNEITKKSTREYTILKVNKWASYQYSNQEPTNDATNEPYNGATTPKENKNIRIQEKKEIYKERKFVHPSLEDVIAYCRERRNNVDPQKWFDYYSANGWKVGKNPMKDWKAAVRTWERNSTPRMEDKLPTYDSSSNRSMSMEDEEELLKLMGKA